MSKTIQHFSILAIFSLLITFLVWLPHLLRLNNFYGLNFSEGFATIYRNFDGIEYIIISKSLYRPELISPLPQALPSIYFASHFPGYALLILLFSPILGFLKSMLFVSLLSTVLASWIFYKLIRDFNLSSQPLWMSIIFLVLPARWLVVHSVGSSEPTFILFTITALYFFMKFEQSKKNIFIWLAALFGLFAQITRPPGILLFIALGSYITWKTLTQKVPATFLKRAYSGLSSYYPLLLIPAGLLLVFSWYALTYGNFLSYFQSGDNIHLTIPPYQVFNKFQYWVGDIWLEDVIYIFLLSFLGGFLLIKQGLYPLAIFVLVYSFAGILVAHRDISRYIMPTFPFVMLSFEKVLVSKEFKIILLILAIGIYLYAQNFILFNTAPIPDPSVFN